MVRSILDVTGNHKNPKVIKSLRLNIFALSNLIFTHKRNENRLIGSNEDTLVEFGGRVYQCITDNDQSIKIEERSPNSNKCIYKNFNSSRCGESNHQEKIKIIYTLLDHNKSTRLKQDEISTQKNINCSIDRDNLIRKTNRYYRSNDKEVETK